MIDFTKGIFQSDEFLKIHLNGNWCNINEAEYPQAWAEVQSYLLTHPDALQPEPLPPPPTKEQLEAQAEAQRQAYFAEYDHAIDVLNNQLRRGSITKEFYDAKVAEWDVFAIALELVNDEPDWYIDTIWPRKPL